MKGKTLLTISLLVASLALFPGCKDSKTSVELDFSEDSFIPDIDIEVDFPEGSIFPDIDIEFEYVVDDDKDSKKKITKKPIKKESSNTKQHPLSSLDLTGS